MIDFTLTMTSSFVNGIAMFNNAFKNCVRITFLFCLFIFYSGNAAGQCAYSVSESALTTGEHISFSSIQKSTIHYWFGFTAISTNVIVKTSDVEGLAVLIGESYGPECEWTNVSSLNTSKRTARDSGASIQTIATDLVPGEKYYVVIAAPEPENASVSFQSFEGVKLSDLGSKGGAETIENRDQVHSVKKELDLTRAAENKFAVARKIQSTPTISISREELITQIASLKKRIAEYELRVDRNEGELNKMETSLANWEQQLLSTD